MKPSGLHRRVAGLLAVAVLAPAFTAWSHTARPAGRALACARVPITSEPADGTGSHQPQWDMPPMGGALDGIAARSSSSAVAVGLHLLAGAPAVSGLIVRWNGTAWTTLNGPALPSASELTGVAMFDGGAWAVGQQDVSEFGDPSVGLPLLVRVTPTTVRPVPVPQAPQGSTLLAVAATSATDAWAVGSIEAASPLVWHWNGTEWKNVRLPAAVSRVLGPLDDVAATSTTNVWLVGTLGAGHSRIVHWNGRRWNVVSPNIGRPYGLAGVAATSARNVWAVGGTNPGSRMVMLHWNGRRWTCALTTKERFAGLSAVSASSAGNAWAVGDVPGVYDLAVHWNGRTWKQVKTPQPGQGNVLQGVGFVPRSNRGWAVGFTDSSGTLMLHWNGTAWK